MCYLLFEIMTDIHDHNGDTFFRMSRRARSQHSVTPLVVLIYPVACNVFFLFLAALVYNP